jgi:hypothetical protein
MVHRINILGKVSSDYYRGAVEFENTRSMIVRENNAKQQQLEISSGSSINQ